MVLRPYLHWLVAAGLLAAFTWFAWYGSAEQRFARACDEEIKRSLVAPSTYRRVKAELQPVYGGNIVFVHYDADNAMGVPIRNTWRCTVPN